jgi:hypothetical protein
MSDPSSSAPPQMAKWTAKEEARSAEVESGQDTVEHLRRLLALKEKELEETKQEFELKMRNTLALQRNRYEAQIRELREGRRARVGLLRPKSRG